MQNSTQFNTKSYHNQTDTNNDVVIIHKNQTNIFQFLPSQQLTIYDFLKDKKC